jgi:leucyl aminopeptidase
MEIRSSVPLSRDVDALVVPWIDDVATSNEWWEEPAKKWLEENRTNEGRAGWVVLGREDRPDLFLVSIAPTTKPIEESVRQAAGQGVRAARELGLRSVAVRVPDGAELSIWQAVAEGLVLGDWSYDALRDSKGQHAAPKIRVLCTESEPVEGATDAVKRGQVLAEAQNLSRELVTLPGNVATPQYLATVARRLSGELGFQATVWGPDKLREEGFGALLAVAKGSVEEPCFLILEHAGQGGDPYVVVGKGVTFDAGGISLKLAKGMEKMKYDMGGAAAVFGILAAAARLDIPQRVVGLIPATENLPSGSAVKPGDVIRGLSGKSIEVINTDAEGRLILSDALTYAQRLSPKVIVDIATLTGACVVALGHHAAGLMSPSDKLAEELLKAGKTSGERTWRLPLWSEFRSQLDSAIADIKNTGGSAGGTITAGWFLRDFVDDEISWAHLDIAGTTWANDARGWQPKGATGIGVRLIHEWLRDCI